MADGRMSHIGILMIFLRSFELVFSVDLFHLYSGSGTSRRRHSIHMIFTRIRSCTVPMAFRQVFVVARASLALIILLALPVSAEKATSADTFVDSVGVNVHLHYLDTSYSNFSRVKQSLVDLGLRHVRDGLVDTTWQDYYNHHNELGRSGIKGIFTTSPSQSDQLLLDYPRRMKDSFEAYESPNEYDQSHNPDWAGTLSEFVTRLNTTVKANPSTSRFPVIGPSPDEPGFVFEASGRLFFRLRQPSQLLWWPQSRYARLGFERIRRPFLESLPCKYSMPGQSGHHNRDRVSDRSCSQARYT